MACQPGVQQRLAKLPQTCSDLRYGTRTMAVSIEPFEPLEILTADGQVLCGRLFRPPAEPKGAVLVAPAMGVPQKFYAAFAAWLARQELLAATFDYRGSGLSRQGSLRGFDADIFDWARLDCAAMLEMLAAAAPGQPLFWVGHSLGGQIFPFVPNRTRVAKMVMVATGSGYWRENTRAYAA